MFFGFVPTTIGALILTANRILMEARVSTVVWP
jgi:hypothetical protein